jgi:hypothetical protein
VSPLVTQLHPLAQAVFKDTYLLDFLNLPEQHSEQDLQHGLVANLRRFLLELGADFTFVGEQFRVQVGGRDFYLDLLFFHRGLNCLVAGQETAASQAARVLRTCRGSPPTGADRCSIRLRVTSMPIIAAGAILIGAIFVLGIFSGYFTRLVVTNSRLLIVQGYEVRHNWGIDDLPQSLLRYGAVGSPTIDLDALHSMMGGSSESVAESKTILKLGKQIDNIRARENGR